MHNYVLYFAVADMVYWYESHYFVVFLSTTIILATSLMHFTFFQIRAKGSSCDTESVPVNGSCRTPGRILPGRLHSCNRLSANKLILKKCHDLKVLSNLVNK